MNLRESIDELRRNVARLAILLNAHPKAFKWCTVNGAGNGCSLPLSVTVYNAAEAYNEFGADGWTAGKFGLQRLECGVVIVIYDEAQNTAMLEKSKREREEVAV